MKFVTVAGMKKFEQLTNQSGVSFYCMMENAGRGAAEVIGREYGAAGKRILVLCGKGNNGGDGFVCAVRLGKMGAEVKAALVKGAPVTDEARKAFAALKETDIELCTTEVSLEGFDIIVDAIFGTGFSGEPDGAMKELFERINSSGAAVVSLDIPSGVAADTGRYVCCIRSDLTVTFEYPKAAHLVHWAKNYMGKFVTVPIGAPKEARESFEGELEGIDEEKVGLLLPARKPWSHKGDNGRLLIVAGSRNFPGAAVMAASGALRSGVGYVSLASTEYVCRNAAAHFPETIYTICRQNESGGISADSLEDILKVAQKSDAVAVGSGMTACADTRRIVRGLLRECTKPLILDADAINVLEGDPSPLMHAKAPVLITPHPGEFSRLTGMHISDIENEFFSVGKDISERYKCSVLLKGAVTSVSFGGKSAFCFMGSSGLAKGGSGDVLTGITGALVSRGMPVFEGAMCAAYLHGLAARETAGLWGEDSMLPSQLPESLGKAFLRIGSRR